MEKHGMAREITCGKIWEGEQIFFQVYVNVVYGLLKLGFHPT